MIKQQKKFILHTIANRTLVKEITQESKLETKNIETNPDVAEEKTDVICEGEQMQCDAFLNISNE